MQNKDTSKRNTTEKQGSFGFGHPKDTQCRPFLDFFSPTDIDTNVLLVKLLYNP